MVSYRLIGTGTTDDNGVATCNNVYTGTGKGEVDIIASTDNPIVQGSLLSETYTTIDALFYDKAVGSSSTLSRWNGYTNFEIVGDDEGTLVTNNNTGNRYLYPKQSSAWVENNTLIEFTYLSHSGTVIFRCNNGTNADQYLNNLDLTNGDVVGLKILDDKIEYYKNGVKLSLDKNFTTGNSYVAFIINNGSVKFKDFKIYPI